MKEKIAEWLTSNKILIIYAKKRGVGKSATARKIFEDAGIKPELVAHIKDIGNWISDDCKGLLIDNASKRSLEDPTLTMLANDVFTARKLGTLKARLVKTPKIIVTTNVQELSPDLERRCIRIELPLTETEETAK